MSFSKAIRGRHLAALTMLAVGGLACSDGHISATGPSAALAATGIQVAPSSLGWQEEGRQLVAANNLSPLAAARVYAVLSVAEYRAVVDADDAKVGGRSLIETRRGAVAGASAQVLTFFFPAAAPAIEARVKSEGEAGPAHPWFFRGLQLGRKAGDALVERAKDDRFTAPWTGTVPAGPGMWIPGSGTPAGATFGNMRSFLLTANDQFRPPPPPAFGSTSFLTDLNEIRTIALTRTPEQLASALFWNFPTGTFTPIGYWNLTAATLIQTREWDERAATHVFALMHAALLDAQIGCWDAKYHYWMLRPSQADQSIALTFTLPNHPSYPSGHSCISASAATVLSHFFPDRASDLADQVTQAGLSRMYAGIHYRFDISAGRDLGTAVADWAIAIDERIGLLKGIR